MLEIIHRKLDNLGELGEMFSSYSRLYLYEKEQNVESEFQSDYLLVHEMDMLNDSAALLEKCTDKREKNLVTDFLALWKKKEDGI